MTEFEYISVALALIYALVVGRLVAALPDALEPAKRYWPHVAWIVALLLACAVAWWSMWALRDVVWTAPRFLFVLSFPAIMYLRAAYLTGDRNDTVVSYEAHFYAVRVRFFTIGVLIGLEGFLISWVVGIAEPGTFRQGQIPGLVLIIVNLLGATITNHRFHQFVAALALCFSFVAPFLTR